MFKVGLQSHPIGKFGQGIDVGEMTKPLFVSVLLADIASDLGEPNQHTGSISDRIDHHVGPKLAAILADTPAFIQEPPILGCDPQGPLWQSEGAIFFGIKPIEILADYFVRSVILRPLSADVPV